MSRSRKATAPDAGRCQVLGTRVGFGHAISHSHVRTKRQFRPNLQRKRYWVPSLGRTVTLRVSARGIKTIDRIGIEAAAARILARGEKL